MSEIPEDITKSALALCDRLETPATQGTVYVIADEIFRWVLRERERCADVAKNWRRKKTGRDLSKASFDPCGRWEGGETYEEGRPQELIASAIRNPKP